VVEDIITALSRVRWFFVIARNSSFTYKGRAVDIRQVGRELGVRYVLEGAIRKAGGRIRITGQLIETTSGRHVWADRFDGDFSDVFKLQDQITESVVGAIEPNIQQAEIERAKHKSTRNPDAYDHLLCALPLLATGNKESTEQAHHLLTRAIEADPNYAHAMALLSTSHHFRVIHAWGTDDDTQEGLRLANKAIAIGHNDPLVLAVAAMSLAYFSRDLGKAAHIIERSLALHPASASTHSRAGWLRNYMGQPERAITHFETAMRLSPVDLEMSQFLTGLSVAQLQIEQWLEACGTAQRALDLQANWGGAHRARVVGFVHLGMMNEAEVAARKMLEAMPRFSLSEYIRTTPFKANAWWKWVDALRKAGLPE
jgi:adenylate cyclase